MAAVQKRRSSSRVKTQKTAKVSEAKQKGPVRPSPWVREVVTLLILASGVFLLLSMGSHAFFRLMGESSINPSRNIMGPIGHVVATLLMGTIGWASFIPVLGLLWLAFFRSWQGRGGDSRYSTSVSLVAAGVIIIGATGILGVAGGNQLGGSVGHSLAALLVGTLGLGGAILVIGLLLAVGGAIVLQRSVGDVAAALQWSVRTVTIFGCVRVPVLAWRSSMAVFNGSARACGDGARGLGRLLFTRSLPEPEPRSLPKPKIRKNTVPVLDGGSAAAPIELTEPVYERADPIIVKPKLTDGSGLKTLRANDRSGKASKDAKAESSFAAFDDYIAPDLKFLTREEGHEMGEDDEELRQKAEQIEAKLRDFNIAGRVTQVHPGPVITLFEFEPAAGVKVGRIAALQDDLAMSLKASSIRIIAPIPKRGTVGIEVPNKHRAMVRLRDCLECEDFSTAESILSVPLGKDTYGDAVVVDIATMPHLLMAGATGTGKSVCINALLLSLLYKAHPSELGLILIDPKVLELSIYDGIPHLRVPVVTDPRQAKAVLSWAVKEMDRRYRYMQRFGVRNIDGYNQIVAGENEKEKELSPVLAAAAESDGVLDEVEDGEENSSKEAIEPVGAEQLKPLPKLVIVIDELADLMLTVGREIEELITRLAQKARAAGIHLIVATQRPSVDVITGLIKANFPARLSFRVSSRIDSRTILDSMGAEKLLGKGDMLFMLPGAVPLKRIHGAFVSDQEVQRVVTSLKNQCGPQYDENIIAACEKALSEESGEGREGGGNGENSDDFDPFYDKAVELVVEKGQASTSMIQRTFRIGYNRAARIIEMMEREGVVGKMDGVKPREILAPPIQRSVPN